MMNKKLLDELFNIDLESGKFYWKKVSKYHNEKNGKEAGGIRAQKSGKKYWIIKINGIAYKRGRLIFLYLNGHFPLPCVDHINGDSLDDCPSNLRQASMLENSWNHKKRKKKSKLPMGVRMSGSRYMARIACNKKTIYLGVFDTPELAYSVYKNKRIELYGEFSGF